MARDEAVEKYRDLARNAVVTRGAVQNRATSADELFAATGRTAATATSLSTLVFSCASIFVFSTCRRVRICAYALTCHRTTSRSHRVSSASNCIQHQRHTSYSNTQVELVYAKLPLTKNGWRSSSNECGCQ